MKNLIKILSDLTIAAGIAIYIAFVFTFIPILLFILLVVLPAKALSSQEPRSVDMNCTEGTRIVCRAYFTDTIDNPQDYHHLIHTLTVLNKGDIIYINLAGTGGRLDSTVRIIHAIQSSKATVIIVVTGAVYSAHAFIAMSADQIDIKPFTYFMFHHSSLLGLDCSQFLTKSDRNQSAFVKCKQHKFIHLETTQKLIVYLTYGILTNDEIEDILIGKNVYIDGHEMQKRISNKKADHFNLIKLLGASND